MPLKARRLSLEDRVLPHLSYLHEDSTQVILEKMRREQALTKYDKFASKFRVRNKTKAENIDDRADIMRKAIISVVRAPAFFALRVHRFLNHVHRIQAAWRKFTKQLRERQDEIIERWMLAEASSRQRIKREVKYRLSRGSMNHNVEKVVRHLWAMYMDCWHGRDRMASTVRSMWMVRKQSFAREHKLWRSTGKGIDNPEPCCFFSRRNVTPKELGVLDAHTETQVGSKLGSGVSSVTFATGEGSDMITPATVKESTKVQSLIQTTADYYCMLLDFSHEFIPKLIQFRQKLGKKALVVDEDKAQHADWNMTVAGFQTVGTVQEVFDDATAQNRFHFERKVAPPLPPYRKRVIKETIPVPPPRKVRMPLAVDPSVLRPRTPMVPGYLKLNIHNNHHSIKSVVADSEATGASMAHTHSWSSWRGRHRTKHFGSVYTNPAASTLSRSCSNVEHTLKTTEQES